MTSLTLEALKGLKNLSKDELMDLTGLGNKRESNTSDNVLPMLAVFGAGLLTGLCAGMLLAPNSGEESRKKIANRAEDATEAGSEMVDRVRKQVSPS